MLISQLSKTIDPCKLARQGKLFEGSLAVACFSRLVDVLADDQGEVRVELRFYVDECSNVILEGCLNLECNMICQRCLDVADISVHVDILLMAVWTDEQAKALSVKYDPLFLQKEPIELIPLLEDELLLGLPLIPYHNSDCYSKQIWTAKSKYFVGRKGNENVVNKETDNPFSALAKLKADVATIQES
ncbi:MAG: YceD family protein [Candidatus Endonucleobacter bathymodioli]|uniref:Large ribosomal RNA subunit accumulation protein YceD n=1 Tax=Candidatus Endonucleibacter bathymodioli TaxID=539814 RepID=A0AA90SWP4_9GAMM|nr:YceD family protein [Candidatus Endonucleobacter bathymodioli]